MRMGGILLLLAFEGLGLVIANRLFRELGGMVRAWLGLSLGLGMMMWFPVLFAFALDFTALAQYLALALAAALAGASLLVGRRNGAIGIMPAEPNLDPPISVMLWTVLPLLLITAYLQYTHTLRPVDGALHVGQSTYGDLNLHLGIATSLRNASFPPEYSLLPGTPLGYPFLVDSLSTSMLLLGTPLRWAFILPGVLMCTLIYLGFALLAWRITHGRAATILAFFLVFLNGGLGFAYSLDLVVQDPSRLRDVFLGFYLAPANLIDLNVRWSNIIADMLVPQRTLMAGWMMLLPAIYLLTRAIQKNEFRLFILLGIWAGAMPMVHTHSFLALGMLSGGAMMYALLRAKPGERYRMLMGFVMYGATALVLALPQLIAWAFPQTSAGGYPKFRLNWVNSTDGKLIDGYFWFWIKNVGLVYLLMLPAGLFARGWRRALALGALLIYGVAELIQFQPNAYDNNKLFYVAFLIMIPLVARYALALYGRLRGLPGRRLLAGAFIAASLLSGALSVARELISDYELYSAGDVAAAHYVEQNAPADALFLTGGQHNNVISTLTGRKLVCGTSTFLYFHGVDYNTNAQHARLMYEAPLESQTLYENYGVDYIYISWHERSSFTLDEAAIATLWPVWYSDADAIIYAVSERAQSSIDQ